MEESVLFAALDRAMALTAKDEFWRLAPVPAREASGNITHALDDLKQLRAGISPDYSSRWLALFYLTRYQAGHIRLARRMIGELDEKREGDGLLGPDKDCLVVVDFGCGTLATLFAVAWAVAEDIERGVELKPVRVGCYDKSRVMLDLGVTLWKTFKSEIKNELGLGSLHRVAATIRAECTYAEPTFSREKLRVGQDRWLTGLHTVYSSAWEDTQRSLSNLAESFQPDVGLLSCYEHHDSIRSLQRASPFMGGGGSPFSADAFNRFESRMTFDPDHSLCEITKWQHWIREKCAISHSYLNGPVKTWCARSYCLTYLKQ